MRLADHHFISVTPFIHLSLWTICSLQDRGEGCYSDAWRWTISLISRRVRRALTVTIFPPGFSVSSFCVRSLTPFLFYPSSLTGRWHLKWRWQEAPPCFLSHSLWWLTCGCVSDFRLISSTVKCKFEHRLVWWFQNFFCKSCHANPQLSIINNNWESNWLKKWMQIEF